MADFMDQEAVESDDEDLSDEDDRKAAAAAAAKKKSAKMISSDEEEDEDEDEEKAREEMKGFIADDDEDEDGGGGSGSGSGSNSDSSSDRKRNKKRKKKKKKKRRRHGSGSGSRSDASDDDDGGDDIDDEDMELLQENLGIKFKKQRKRIRMDSEGEDDDDDDDNNRQKKRRQQRDRGGSSAGSGGDDDDELPDVEQDYHRRGQGRDATSASATAAAADYGSGDEAGEDYRSGGGGGLGGSGGEQATSRPARANDDEDEEDGYESEDVNDFIVDEDGKPLKQKDPKKKKKHIFSDSARQMAEDIFGVAFDYEEFEDYGDDDVDEEDDEDMDEDDEDMDDEEGDEERKLRKKQRLQQQKLKKKRKTTAKSIFEIYEPKELELRHFTDQDNEIRNTDMPERMQLRETPVTPVAEGPDDEVGNELDREAEWIFRQGFAKPSISRQEGTSREECSSWHRKETAVVEKIRKALDFMRQQFFEVPFIAFYRKEYVLPELKINDLWRVYHMDELWCKLQARKKNLRRLMQNMQAFQTENIMADPDKPLPDGVRILSNEDIAKVDSVETFEELKDRDQHFKLYYGRDIPAMQETVRRKRLEARESRKNKKAGGRKTKIVTRKVKVRHTKTVTDEETGEEREVTDDEAPSEYEEVEEEEDVEDDDEDDVDENDDEDLEKDHETLKHATRNDPYSLCQKYGLIGIAGRFGLSAENFGENLKDGYQKVDVEQDPSDPLEVAAEYTNEKFDKPEDVLAAARFLLATQIAREPLVRREVREAFFDRATFDVRPTKKGGKEVDENHEIYSLLYLKKKPVQSLTGDQWLRLVQAEEQKLVTIDLAVDIKGMTSHKSLVEEAQDLFKQDLFSKSVKEWNALRARCVEMAFKDMLYPMLRKELRNKLTKEAKDGVIRACKNKLYDWIKTAKYSVNFEDEDEDDWDSSHGCRIMGIMYDTDPDVASYAVAITAEGEVAEFVKLEHILKRKNSWNEKERHQKESDVNKLKEFIVRRRPHAVVIGVSDRAAVGIRMDVEDLLKDLTAGEEQFPRLRCFLMDDNLAKVYANSERANQDFRDFPPILRQAISLARRLQDPLVEFSQLTGPENEILCLRFHPLQDALSEDELLGALTVEFINRTNEVGVDINECVAHPHMSNLVQFVGGLGPRKGAALLKTLRQMQSSQPRLENRQQLVTLCHMGPKGFINCAGFIKIDTSSLGDSEVYVEVLDGSRIHNEAYEWARKMAVDALEYDEEDGNPANALEEIINEPDKLAELDLDAFATELERQGFGKKSITLCDIRSELYNMYKDLREPYKEPDDEEVFNMVTKETPHTFYIGKLVTASVVGFVRKKPQAEEMDSAAPVRIGDTNLWQCPFCGQDDFPELTEVWNHFDAGTCPGKAVGVRVRLDNGVSGFIPMKNLSDSNVLNPEERVRIGQSISCRITRIQPERFSVEASSKSSALADRNNDLKPRRDDYYDQEAEDKDRGHEQDKEKAKARRSYTKRVIIHPSFYNIGFNEAVELMKNMDQGDVIVRPSSKGADHLTVTWKVSSDPDGVLQHIDVKEEGKSNAFSLGSTLLIGAEEFEDLDEIIARHVNPMAALARDLMNFKYYRGDVQGGRREAAEEILRVEKRAHPNKIHYILSASKELPGKFLLSYMPRNRAVHEYVTVTPDGFRFRRDHMFDSPGALIKWFKEHFRDPIPGTPSGTMSTPGGGASARGATSAVNRTPYLTPTGGGGITPGAMSLAAGGGHTPYGHTPLGGYGASIVNTPYTPSGITPVLTPFNTPGPSVTPRPASGATGPSGRNASAHHQRSLYGPAPVAPRGVPAAAGYGGVPARSTSSSSTHHQGRGSSTSISSSSSQQYHHRAGGPFNASSAMPPPSTSHHRSSSAYGNQTPRGFTPLGGKGHHDRGREYDRNGVSGPTSSGGPGSVGRRTPKGGNFGDATPLYDE